MQKKLKSGFTILELSLTIAYLSVFLVIIVVVTRGLAATYRRGLSIKQINSMGSNLIDEFTNSVTNSSALDPALICSEYYAKGSDNYNNCISDEANLFTFQQHIHSKSVTSYGTVINNAPAYGIFCTGTYSYIWNTGYAFEDPENTYYDNDGSKEQVKKLTISYSYKNSEGAIAKETIGTFRLLKIRDDQRAVCGNKIANEYPVVTNSEITDDDIQLYDISTIYKRCETGTCKETNNYFGDEIPTEIISESALSGGLAIYQFLIYPPAVDEGSGNRFYTGSFMLGTVDSGAAINPIGDSCVVPIGKNYDSDYCAINKFNFAIRAIGGQ